MPIAIAALSMLPAAPEIGCWRQCACDLLCPSLGALACAALALGAGVAIYALLSIARELHLLTR